MPTLLRDVGMALGTRRVIFLRLEIDGSDSIEQRRRLGRDPENECGASTSITPQ